MSLPISWFNDDTPNQKLDVDRANTYLCQRLCVVNTGL